MISSLGLGPAAKPEEASPRAPAVIDSEVPSKVSSCLAHQCSVDEGGLLHFAGQLAAAAGHLKNQHEPLNL